MDLNSNTSIVEEAVELIDSTSPGGNNQLILCSADETGLPDSILNN